MLPSTLSFLNVIYEALPENYNTLTELIVYNSYGKRQGKFSCMLSWYTVSYCYCYCSLYCVTVNDDYTDDVSVFMSPNELDVYLM